MNASLLRRAANKRQRLTEPQANMLRCALVLATDRYAEFAREFQSGADKVKAMTPAQKAAHQGDLINPVAYDGLAEQFRRQCTETHELTALLCDGPEDFEGEIFVDVLYEAD